MLPAVVSYRRDESSAHLLTASEAKMAVVSFDHIAYQNPTSDLITHRNKKDLRVAAIAGKAAKYRIQQIIG